MADIPEKFRLAALSHRSLTISRDEVMKIYTLMAASIVWQDTRPGQDSLAIARQKNLDHAVTKLRSR